MPDPTRYTTPAGLEGRNRMAEIFYGLAILACPVGMGVMMWMMMRGGKQETSSGASPDEGLAQLRAEVEQLRAQQGHTPSSPAARTPAPTQSSEQA